jgi:hypothetical protein
MDVEILLFRLYGLLALFMGILLSFTSTTFEYTFAGIVIVPMSLLMIITPSDYERIFPPKLTVQFYNVSNHTVRVVAPKILKKQVLKKDAQGITHVIENGLIEVDGKKIITMYPPVGYKFLMFE